MEAFNKDSMQLTMNRTGFNPSDFRDIMPCHKGTLYRFLRTGEAKQLNVFLFESIYKFLNEGLAKGVFPGTGIDTIRKRKSLIESSWKHWNQNNYSLDSYSSI